MVPGQGFEPRFADPKSAVLPLDDPGIRQIVWAFYELGHFFQRKNRQERSGEMLRSKLRETLS